MVKVPNRPEEHLNWALSGTEDSSAQEFSNLLISANFWKRWDEHPDLLTDDEAIERAIAIAKFEALGRGFEIADLPERSTALMLLDASRTGWQRRLPAEYANTAELLAGVAGRIESEDNESSRRDLQFAVDEFLPALARAGVDVVNVMNIPKRWSKTRVAIPYVRAALSDMKGEELSGFLKDMVDVIVDPDISVRKMRTRLKDNGYKEHPVIDGSVYQLHGGKYVFVAVVNYEGLNWLAKVLRFTVADILQPFEKLVGFIKGLVA